MKRLRAPEHSDSRSTSPAAGTPADTAAPPADPAAPSSAAVPEVSPVAVIELPAGAPPESGAAAAAEEPQQPNPAPQAAEPASRCNGEASAILHTAAEAGDEQG